MKQITKEDLEKVNESEDQTIWQVWGTPFLLVKHKGKFNWTCGRTQIGKDHQDIEKAIEALNEPDWGMLTEVMYAISKMAIQFRDDERIANAQGQASLE